LKDQGIDGWDQTGPYGDWLWVRTEFTWLRIGITGRLLWMRWWTFRFWHHRVSSLLPLSMCISLTQFSLSLLDQNVICTLPTCARLSPKSLTLYTKSSVSILLTAEQQAGHTAVWPIQFDVMSHILFLMCQDIYHAVQCTIHS
jgi:hypothetical protein